MKNDEVISAIPKFARARDLRLRSIQGTIARASVPAVRIVDALFTKEKLSSQDHVNFAIDCCSIILAANSGLNQLGRELLKGSLHKKYQSLCNKAPAGPTKLLFGDNLSERVKAANATSSLMATGSRGRGRGMFGAQRRFSPYGQPLYSSYAGCVPHHGFQSYRRGRPFLGRLSKEIDHNDSNQDETVAHTQMPSFQRTCLNETDMCFPVSRAEEPRWSRRGGKENQK